ncbi:DUF3311 domain-containing protein [Mariniblastus sp.]|jgi:hypothetical protein|nr:DUF3311 domain-containing protein [bacterium]MDA7903113.1 DUF3311 domain-containing protein [Mariniblastus sp.]MDA7906702.1 DUF3311 domain-containing protein [Mariniblastus sp.]MDB4372894.1 DUF3311 domain-containing protein [Mariniblastus sp.]MDB4386078.1 DUF3311 domain-containing protein [bacterium]
MRLVIILMVLSLLVLHQDFWNWNREELSFGFLPIGLTYHIGISLGATFVWWFACTFAWPSGVDTFDEQSSESGDQS